MLGQNGRVKRSRRPSAAKCDTVKVLSEAPMYVSFNGRIMKAVEMWRKANLDPAEIKLRKLVIHCFAGKPYEKTLAGRSRALCLVLYAKSDIPFS